MSKELIIYQIVGFDIKEVREDLGLSIRQFAKRLGIEPSTVSRWESGQTIPTTAHVYKLQQFYDKEVNGG